MSPPDEDADEDADALLVEFPLPPAAFFVEYNHDPLDEALGLAELLADADPEEEAEAEPDPEPELLVALPLPLEADAFLPPRLPQ